MQVKFILDNEPVNQSSTKISTLQELSNTINQTFAICNSGDKVEFDFVNVDNPNKFISLINTMTAVHAEQTGQILDVHVNFFSEMVDT
jgi:hypothetical protein